jgi:hypothetical protein
VQAAKNSVLYRGATLQAAEKLMLCSGHDFSRAVKIENTSGFTGCGKTHVLYQGTTLVGP